MYRKETFLILTRGNVWEMDKRSEIFRTRLSLNDSIPHRIVPLIFFLFFF